MRTMQSHPSKRQAVSPGIVLLLLSLGLSACGEAKTPAAADSTPPEDRVRKVLLISIDTLRADYLTPYDSTMRTSPNLAALAEDAVLFTDAIAQGGSTTPSHHSIFYGLYPWIHKATVGKRIPQETPLPPMQVLRERGMLTAGFVGGGKVSDRFGFGQGFELYEDISRLKSADADKQEWERRRIPELERRATEWLDEHHKSDFFLFLHTYKVHCPYDPPEEIAVKYTDVYHGGEYRCGGTRSDLTVDESYVDYIQALYAGEVEYVDAFLGRLVKQLKKLGIYDQTMIVILADHGELLGESNQIGHNSIHQICLRVPLLIRVPGVPPRRVEDPVELIDVMPTIFAATGSEPPYLFQGVDLLPLMRGRAAPERERTRFASSSSTVAVQTAQWKLAFSLLDDRVIGLYDLSSPAAEEQDLADAHPEIVTDLLARFRSMLETNADLAAEFVLPGDEQTPVVDEHLQEQLRTLGYVE